MCFSNDEKKGDLTPMATKLHTVRLSKDGFARMQRLVGIIAQHGWTAAGLAKKERVTLSAVLDEAVTALEQQIKARLMTERR
jgi:hypothetical protein